MKLFCEYGKKNVQACANLAADFFLMGNGFEMSMGCWLCATDVLRDRAAAKENALTTMSAAEQRKINLSSYYSAGWGS
ncbi:hypothetical protein FACS1894216_05000 [Synergistales bacterium]|nr:hypothetical protein FACS1894216_05000 [Synergistales bacterium]